MTPRPLPPIAREAVLAGISEWVEWWVGNRRKKLIKLHHESHAVNPFLLPIIMSMHGFASVRDLAFFMLSGHLVEGHATGFGKLIDEKVLGKVFGTIKVDRRFRKANPKYGASAFDNVDHIVPRPGASPDLLSLKAGRWSIQLGQAVQINRSFQVLVRLRDAGEVDFDNLVVGVFYGKAEDLTDKYRLIRGEQSTTGAAQHDVRDLTDHVVVVAGREFWSWLNAGETETQDWILDGIIRGFEVTAAKHGSLAGPFEEFVDSFAETFTKHTDDSGKVDWHALLTEING